VADELRLSQACCHESSSFDSWFVCGNAGFILIPPPVEKQQNRRILRGFLDGGTKNSHKTRGSARTLCFVGRCRQSLWAGLVQICARADLSPLVSGPKSRQT
jgi:hypothetical protein